MPSYTLRARVNRTLSHGGKDYTDGDSITLSKSEAERIALDFRSFRFIPKDGGDEISTASLDESTAPSAPRKSPTAP